MKKYEAEVAPAAAPNLPKRAAHLRDIWQSLPHAISAFALATLPRAKPA